MELRQKICSVVLYLYVYSTISLQITGNVSFFKGKAQISNLGEHFIGGTGGLYYKCRDPAIIISFPDISIYRSTFLGEFSFSGRIIQSLMCRSAKYSVRLPWCSALRGLRMRW